MADENCTCCGTDKSETVESGTDVDRWVTETPVTEEELPTDLRTVMRRFFGGGSSETRESGGSISFDNFCHASGQTDHWGVLDGRKYYFQCFYDAVVLAEMTSSPVDIHTKSPDGTVIELQATGEGVRDVTPSDAVVSFGIDRNVETPSDGGPTPEAVYSAICPYIKAFPDRSAYESWAETVPAATVGMPLADGMGSTGKFVG